jgi:hypothetical protein
MKSKLRDLPIPYLGGGFSTDRQMAVIQPCLDLNNVIINSTDGGKSSLNLGNTQTYIQVQGALGITAALNANIFLFSVDINAIYAREIQDDDYSLSFFFIQSVDLPTQAIQPINYGLNALNDFGQGVYNAGLDVFRNICGDQIVTMVHLEADFKLL